MFAALLLQRNDYRPVELLALTCVPSMGQHVFRNMLEGPFTTLYQKWLEFTLQEKLGRLHVVWRGAPCMHSGVSFSTLR